MASFQRTFSDEAVSHFTGCPGLSITPGCAWTTKLGPVLRGDGGCDKSDKKKRVCKSFHFEPLLRSKASLSSLQN